MKRRAVAYDSPLCGKKSNFRKFVLHLAAGSDKGIKKGAGEVAVYHFGIFGYLQ